MGNLTVTSTPPTSILVGPKQAYKIDLTPTQTNSFSVVVTVPAGISTPDRVDLVDVNLLALKLSLNNPYDDTVIDSNSGDSFFYIYANSPEAARNGFNNFAITDNGASLNITFTLDSWAASWYDEDGNITDKPTKLLSALQYSSGNPLAHTVNLTLQLAGGKWTANVPNIPVKNYTNKLNSFRVNEKIAGSWTTVADAGSDHYSYTKFYVGKTFSQGEDYNNRAIQLVNKYVLTGRSSGTPYPIDSDGSPIQVQAIRNLNTSLEWSRDGGSTLLGLVTDTNAFMAVENTTGGVSIDYSSGTRTAIQSGGSSRAIVLALSTGTGVWSLSPYTNYRGKIYHTSSGSVTLSNTATATGSNTLTIYPTLLNAVGTHYVELKAVSTTGAIIARAIYRIVICPSGATESADTCEKAQPLTAGYLKANTHDSETHAYTIELYQWGDSPNPIHAGTLKVWIERSPSPDWRVDSVISNWGVVGNVPFQLPDDVFEEVVTFQFIPDYDFPSEITVRATPQEYAFNAADFIFDSISTCVTVASSSTDITGADASNQDIHFATAAPAYLYFKAANGSLSQNISDISGLQATGYKIEYSYCTATGNILTSDGNYHTLSTGTIPSPPTFPTGYAGIWYFNLKITPGGIVSSDSFRIGCNPDNVDASILVTIDDTRNPSDPSISWDIAGNATLDEQRINIDPATHKLSIAFPYSFRNFNPAIHRIKFTVDPASGTYAGWNAAACCPGEANTHCILSAFQSGAGLAPDGLSDNLITSDRNSSPVGFLKAAFQTKKTPTIGLTTPDVYRFKLEIVLAASPFTTVASADHTFNLIYITTPLNVPILTIDSAYNQNGFILTTNPQTTDVFSRAGIPSASLLDNKLKFSVAVNNVPQPLSDYTLKISPDGNTWTDFDFGSTTNIGIDYLDVNEVGTVCTLRSPYVSWYTDPSTGQVYHEFYLKYVSVASPATDFTQAQVIRLVPFASFGEATFIKYKTTCYSLLHLFVQGEPQALQSPPASLNITSNGFVTTPSYSRWFPDSNINVFKYDAFSTSASGTVTIEHTAIDDPTKKVIVWSVPLTPNPNPAAPSLLVSKGSAAPSHTATGVSYVNDVLTFTATPGSPTTAFYVASHLPAQNYFATGIWTIYAKDTPGQTVTFDANGQYKTTMAAFRFDSGASLPDWATQVYFTSHIGTTPALDSTNGAYLQSSYFGVYPSVNFTTQTNGQTDIYDFIWTQENATVSVIIGSCDHSLTNITLSPPDGDLLDAAIINNTTYNQSINVVGSSIITGTKWEVTRVVPKDTNNNPIDIVAHPEYNNWTTATTLAKVSQVLLNYNLAMQFTNGQMVIHATGPVKFPTGQAELNLAFSFEVTDPQGACASFSTTLPIRNRPVAKLTIANTVINDINLCDLYDIKATPITVSNNRVGSTPLLVSEVELKITAVSVNGISYPGGQVKLFMQDSGLDIRQFIGNNSGWFFGTLGDLPVANGLNIRGTDGGTKGEGTPVFNAATTSISIDIQAKYTDVGAGNEIKYGYATLTATVNKPSAYSTLSTLVPTIVAHSNTTGRTCPSVQSCGYSNEEIELTFNYSQRVNLTDYKLYVGTGLGTTNQKFTQASITEVVYDAANKKIKFTPKAGGSIAGELAKLTAPADVALVVMVPASTLGSLPGLYGRTSSCVYGYFDPASPSVLTANYRYLGAKTTITVNPAVVSLAYPTDTATNLPITHVAPQGATSVTSVQYERKLPDGSYTPVSSTISVTNPTSTQIKYTLPNVIFNSTTATTTGPTLEYRITFIAASGSTTTTLTINPTGTDIEITSVDPCSSYAKSGSIYTKTYTLLCNICTQESLGSILWDIVGVNTDFLAVDFEYPDGSNHQRVTIKSAANIILNQVYVYTLRGSVALPDGTKKEVTTTCSFTGTTDFKITSEDLSTTVGSSFTKTLTTINATCDTGTPNIVWSMGPSSTDPSKFPTGLGLTLSTSGVLSWLPVPNDPTVLDYTGGYTYVIHVTAEVHCGLSIVATTSKDLNIVVGASAIQLISMTPSTGFYDTINVVSFVGNNFIDGIRVNFDNMEGVVTFINSGLLEVATSKVPQPDADIELATRVHMYNPDGGVLPPIQEPLYTFIPQVSPALNTITPSSGSPLGWTKVSIKGRNFEPFSRVYASEGLHSDPVTDKLLPIVYITPDEVVFLTLPHAAGSIEIRVTNRAKPDGVISYTFKDGPAITAITPSIISSEGDTATVYITGTNFYGIVDATGILQKPRVFIDDFEVPSSNITIVQS